MEKEEILKRIEEMLKYYAIRKEETTGTAKHNYETKFFCLKNLWDSIVCNLELPDCYKKVIYGE